MLLGTQRIGANGHLEIGGCDAVSLARQFGTPLYVIDEAAFRDNCRRFKSAFEACYPKVEVLYAGKALLTIALARIVEQEGLGIDVAALGELHVALKAEFPAGRIALHGSNKSYEELSAGVQNGIGHIVVDNFYELGILADIASASQVGVDVLIRATPGVDPVTHRLIRTGQADTKFGFNISDGSALQAVKCVMASPGLRYRGLHCHIGSQLLDAETHLESIEIMTRLMQAVRNETGATTEILNIGGGLGVRYVETDQPPTYETFAESITAGLKSALDSMEHPYPTLILEPGRALVAEAGTTLYTVGAIKTVPISTPPGNRVYVSIDGGMSDNPRPQLYQAVYECLLANRAAEDRSETVTIAGKHCETDILIWNARLPRPEPGDTLAVQTTGAYNHSMASNYNRFLRPPVVLVNDGEAEEIVVRETLDDLLTRERLPERLA